jgi:RNA polymerase sigma-70 factor (ECF subfamily)
MDSTSVSLLRRLRKPEHEAAWARFVELYAPLIFHWAKTRGLSPTDAADLVQDVLTVLVEKLPEFEYDPNRRFRGWLRTVTLNKANDFHRRNNVRANSGLEESIAQVSVAGEVDLFEESQYRNYLVHRALELMQAEFRETTWQAAWQQIAEGRKAADVAADLGISANAAYVAKCRVVRRLREELDGLMD